MFEKSGFADMMGLYMRQFGAYGDHIETAKAMMEGIKMSIQKNIDCARSHLKFGNPNAYARIMCGNIRAAISAKADRAYRQALASDGFPELAAQKCPVAQ